MRRLGLRLAALDRWTQLGLLRVSQHCPSCSGSTKRKHRQPVQATTRLNATQRNSSKASLMSLPQSLLPELEVVREEVKTLLRSGIPHSFSRAIFEKLRLEEAQFADYVNSTCDLFKRYLEEYDSGKTIDAIPKISHRLWITDPENPHSPPIEYLEQISRVNSASRDWENIFWTNSPSLNNSLSSYFNGEKDGTRVRLLHDAFADDPLLAASQEFIACRKFVCSSDMVRIMLLRNMGGLYADLGVSYSRTMRELVSHASAAVNIDFQLMFQLAFLGFPKNCEFLSFWYKICLCPDILTAAIYSSIERFDGEVELSFLSGPGFTAAVLLFLGQPGTILVVPQQGKHIQIRSQQSWYGLKAKFGNTIVKGTDSTRLSVARHNFCRASIPEVDQLSPREIMLRAAAIKGE